MLLLIILLWAVFALMRLVWALLPAPEPVVLAESVVINPVSNGGSQLEATDVDIEQMRNWHLFGKAGAGPSPEELAEQAKKASALEGIEEGARETRLNVKLRGIVASTEDGLGHAIIEHKNKQAVYAVEDKLPLPGNVKLAKVMPRQVILDNGGTYERLVLFEASDIATQAPLRPPPQQANNGEEIDKREQADVTALASDYRQRLFQNPQSLAEVVKVSAVRQDGSLKGYRLAPGSDRNQFEQLGFKAGDLVTSVNGITLDDPANTMRLYNAMRSAGEVVFDLERGGEPLTLSVSLGGDAPQ
ncbi:MAG: type II secretion system protein GspC [Pseudomonadota bacterium]